MPVGPADLPDDFVTPAVAGLTPYEPGRPVEEVQRELGLDRVVKLASNEGPFPPSGTHEYDFMLYALDVEKTDIAERAGQDDFLRATDGHVLASAQLLANFTRQ